MVTQEKFEAFEEVRQSGQTNMFNVAMVKKLAKMMSGVVLSEKDITDIFRSYSQYKKEFSEEEVI